MDGRRLVSEFVDEVAMRVYTGLVTQARDLTLPPGRPRPSYRVLAHDAYEAANALALARAQWQEADEVPQEVVGHDNKVTCVGGTVNHLWVYNDAREVALCERHGCGATSRRRYQQRQTLQRHREARRAAVRAA